MNKHFLKYCMFYILLFLFYQSFADKQAKIDSLQEQLKVSKDTMKVKVLNALAEAYKEISPEKIIEYGKQALILSQNLEYKKGEIDAFDNIGLGYYSISNYEKALENYLKSLKIKEKIFNEIETIVTLDNIGNAYENLSKYDKALEYHLKSLKIKENICDEQGVSNSLYNIGVVYYRLNNYEKSIEYYLKSLEISEKIGNKKIISSTLNNIGVIYDCLGNYEKALKYHKKALKIKEEIDDKIGIAYSLNNIGAVYWHSVNYDKALEYYLKSLKIKEEIGNKKDIAISFFNIGETYLIIQNYDKAFFYLEKALEFAIETKTKLLIQTIYKTISEYYSSKNDFQKALEYHILYTEIKDSIYTEKSSKQIAEMQTKYETEKKEKEIKLKDLELTKKQGELKLQMLIIYFLFIIFLAIIVFSILLYRQFRQKKLANILLSKQNEEILFKNMEISNQKEEIESALDNLKKTQSRLIQSEKMASISQLTAGMAHELNNPINYITGGIASLSLHIKDMDTIFRKYEEINPENIQEKTREIEKTKKELEYDLLKKEIDPLIQSLHNGANRAIDILQSLRTFSHFDQDSLKPTDIHKNLDATIALIRNKFEDRIKILKEYDKIPAIESYPGSINQVFMNILLNAVEAIECEGQITIKTSTDEEKRNVYISIIDTGQGIAKEIYDKIFEPFFTTKEVRKGAGLGLSVAHSIVEEHHGKIEVESETSKGTTIKIILPIMQ